MEEQRALDKNDGLSLPINNLSLMTQFATFQETHAAHFSVPSALPFSL